MAKKATDKEPKTIYSCTLRNQFTGIEKTISASSENELEEKIHEQCAQWDIEKEVRDLNGDITCRIHEIEGILGNIPSVSVEKYYRESLCWESVPQEEEYEKKYKVPFKIPLTDKYLYWDQNEAKKRKLQANAEYNKDLEAYRERKKSNEEKLESKLSGFSTNPNEIQEYYKWVVNQAVRISYSSAKNNVIIKLLYDEKNRSIKVLVNFQKFEDMPQTREYRINNGEIVPVSMGDEKRKELYEKYIYGLSLRIADAVFKNDRYDRRKNADIVKNVSIQGYKYFFDECDGNDHLCLFISMKISKLQYDGINYERVNPKKAWERIGLDSRIKDITKDTLPIEFENDEKSQTKKPVKNKIKK